MSDTVGITKAKIHHHFPQKEDLGIAMVDFISFVVHDIEICPISSLITDLNNLPERLQESVQLLVTEGKEIFHLLYFWEEKIEREENTHGRTGNNTHSIFIGYIVICYTGNIHIFRCSYCY